VAVEAVIFDWGGTLSEFVPAELVDMWTAAAHHLAPDRADEVVATLTAVEDRFWARTTAACESATLAELLTEASATLGLDVTEAVLEAAADGHLEAWAPHIRHHPDAAPSLAALRERGLALGLLSNTHWPRRWHEELLAADGLDALLDARCYTSEMSHLKPHPAAFGAALDALGVDDPSAAVFVGDRRYDDVFGARRAGLRAVWVENDHSPGWDVEPDAVVTTLSELPAVVDAWR
jgi:putative hydrolase of the HAD superfamily